MHNHLIAFSCFTLGFCSAMVLIVRASIRPSLKRPLKRFLGQNKAFVPKVEIKAENYADQEI